MATRDTRSELKTCKETIREQADRIKQLEAEIARLKELLTGKADAKAAKKPKFTYKISVRPITSEKEHRK